MRKAPDQKNDALTLLSAEQFAINRLVTDDLFQEKEKLMDLCLETSGEAL